MFWDEFYKSCEKYFLPKCTKHYFVFSDSPNIKSNKNITVIYEKRLPWPEAALAKFRYFLSIKEKLLEYDFLYMFNANTKIIKDISEELFLPTREEGLVWVIHIGYINKNNLYFPYERRSWSTAYIPYWEWQNYFFSATSGWTAQAYITLCETCNSWVNEDQEKSIIPIWHDESYINKFFYLHYRIVRKMWIEFGCPELTTMIVANPSILYVAKERFGWYKYLRNINYTYSKARLIKCRLDFYYKKVIYMLIKTLHLQTVLRYINLLR